MELVRELKEPIWRDYVYEHPHGNIFHTPEMFCVFNRTEGYHPELWAVVNDRGHPLALFIPVKITLMHGPVRWITTRTVAHGSVLCTPGTEGKKALDILLRAYQQKASKEILFTELRNMSDMSDLNSLLTSLGFKYEDHLNYLINLNRPVDQILQSFGSRTRKKIRKGLRDGLVKIQEVTSQAELKLWYEILLKTYSHARVPLTDYSLFEGAFECLHPQNMARFLIAVADGMPAACSLELPFKETIYGWYGGSDRNYSQYYPNELLNWHIMEWGAQHGYNIYDFGGAGRPDEQYGVRDFKAKFGGELVHLGRYIHVHAPIRLKFSEFAYALYRKFL